MYVLHEGREASKEIQVLRGPPRSLQRLWKHFGAAETRNPVLWDQMLRGLPTLSWACHGSRLCLHNAAGLHLL